MTISPQIIRVLALLVGMLVVGIVIGRLTAPKASSSVNPQHQVARTTKELTKRYHLTPPVDAQMGEIVTRMEAEMRPHPRGTAERRDIFLKYVPEYRALIPKEHEEAFESHVQAMERRFRRMIRRKEMLDK